MITNKIYFSVDKICITNKTVSIETNSVRNSPSAPILLPQSDTMYTNMANLQQTMLLQQKLFLQALCQNNTLQQSPDSRICQENTSSDTARKRFTAPSLSQYRFVSGQQVIFLLM